MKFVSRMTNLRIVLRPGIQASPLTGTPAIPTLFVQFRDGMATVSDQELQEKMLAHRGFGKDFIKVEEAEADPFKGQRYDSDPVHVLQDIENGRVVNRSRNPVGPNPQAAAAIEEQAKKLAIAMLPDLLKAMQEKEDASAKQVQEETTEPKPKKTASKKK